VSAVRALNPAPELVLRLRLEDEQPHVSLDARSHEDELRLRTWLRRTGAVAALGFALEQALRELDDVDGRRWP
jgi:hypothetical protein